MRIGLIITTIYLLIPWNRQSLVLTIDLQGPQRVSSNAFIGLDASILDGDNSKQTSLNDKVAETKDIEDNTKIPDNGNKIGTHDSMKLDNQIDLEDAENKILETAILERLWSDKLLKKKIQEQIEVVEAEQSQIEVIPQTPEQLEAEDLYDKGMEMLSKQTSDKREAYTFLRKAAQLKHSKARAELAWAHLFGHYMNFNFQYAASEFTELVKEGLPEAHMGMAYLHAIGVGGKRVNQPLVLMHLTLAALGNNTFAQMALGYRYLFGINVPPSCEKSLSYYRKVAKKVASKVTFSSGPFVHRIRLLDESENPSTQENEIIDYYQLLADKGDVQSQVGLGQLYYQGGKAVQQDHQKALEYFKLAAKAENAIGYAFLGKLYLEGSDQIKADNKTALMYFTKAAAMGDPVGQSGLGLMYLKGLGIPKDPLKALNNFLDAADQGWVDGQLQLGYMYLTGNGVKTDYKLALNYFNLASQSGHVLAYYNLGVMHAYGMGMLRSCPAAVEFFKNVAERGRWSNILMHAYSDYKNSRYNEAYMQYALLAELGYEVAQSNAAYLLENRLVTIFKDRNEELIRAFYYWKRAANQDYSSAQVKLGDYYYYGWGTEVDFETAAALYRKASEQQYNAQAMFNLGYMHEQGLGMKKDWHLAKRLYDLAAKTNVDAKVPVAIALVKLQILAKIETIKMSPVHFFDESVAANWDLYLTTILTILFGVGTYMRRVYERELERLQTQIDVGNNTNPTLNESNNSEEATSISHTTLSTSTTATNTTITSTTSTAMTTCRTSTISTNNTTNPSTELAASGSIADPIE